TYIALLVFALHVEGSTGNALLLYFLLSAKIAGTAYVADGMNILAAGKLFGQLLDDLFTHAIQQHIRLCIHQNGWTHGIIPVVVMGKAAQRSLQTADDDGGIRVQLTQFAGIDDGGAVGTSAGLAARGIGVVAAFTFGSGVMGDHRVDVAAGDQEGIFRLTKFLIVAVGHRLRDDADGIAQRFDDARDDGGTEAGVIDIGVADDIDKVQLVPSALEG